MSRARNISSVYRWLDIAQPMMRRLNTSSTQDRGAAARMVYFMLTRGEAFVDQGQQRYEEQQRQRSIAALRRRASALGFQLQPNASAP
jgi:hypothetical protein